ncbi:MAG TPA: putative metal-dependent hydrolase, partial [Saprospirales bacterium]|nr:putative metal-dependent hydrolase [Saprospirales bacterium]
MKEVTDRRFPIGRFEYNKNYTLDDTRKQIKDIARLPKELKKLVKKLKDGALDKPYRQGGWTARQVIHHLADSHMNAYIRFKLAATETAPIIKPYEEKLWAETEDAKHGSAKTSIKLLAALHDRWVDFMISLSEDDLDKGYFHPATKRTVALREAIALYAWHANHHLAHVKLVADGNFEKKKSDDKKKDRKTKSAAKPAPAPKAAAPAGDKPKRGRRPS